MIMAFPINYLSQVIFLTKLNHVCKNCNNKCNVIKHLKKVEYDLRIKSIVLYTDCIIYSEFIDCMREIGGLPIYTKHINKTLSVNKYLTRLYFPN